MQRAVSVQFKSCLVAFDQRAETLGIEPWQFCDKAPKSDSKQSHTRRQNYAYTPALRYFTPLRGVVWIAGRMRLLNATTLELENSGTALLLHLMRSYPILGSNKKSPFKPYQTLTLHLDLPDFQRSEPAVNRHSPIDTCGFGLIRAASTRAVQPSSRKPLTRCFDGTRKLKFAMPIWQMCHLMMTCTLQSPHFPIVDGLQEAGPCKSWLHQRKWSSSLGNGRNSAIDRTCPLWYQKLRKLTLMYSKTAGICYKGASRKECHGRHDAKLHARKIWRTVWWAYSTSTCHYYTVKERKRLFDYKKRY